MLGFHIKQVVRFNLRNKSRLILAIVVIGIAISTMFTLNGLLDIFSNNITTSIIGQLPDADVSITSTKDSYIYNYSTLIQSIESQDQIIKAVTPRYAMDGGVYLNSSQGQVIVPTQIVAINVSKEYSMGMGSFTPQISSLGVNECLVIGNFGQQLLSASPNGNLNVCMLLKPNLSVNMSLNIRSQVDQNKKIYTSYQNLIVIDYSTLQQFNLSNTATSLLGLFKDHENFYSLNSINSIDQLGVKRGSEIQNIIGYDYTVNMIILQALTASQEGLNGTRVLVNLIGIIIILLSTILIWSIMNASLKDLTHEYGIYKALGLKDRWILISSFLNSIFIGMLGILAGFFLGIIFISYANSSLGGLNALIKINPDTILYILGLGILMIIFSGLYPAYLVSKKDVLVALDISRTESTDFGARVESYRFKLFNKKNIIRGFQLASVGLLIFVILPWVNFAFDQNAVNNLVVILLILALIGFIFIISGLLGPILQRSISWMVGVFFPKIGFATHLVLRKTTGKNTSNSVIFALCLAFIFFLNTLQAASINGAVFALQSQVGSDLVVYTPQVNGQSYSEEIYNFTKAYPGVKSGFITNNGFYSLIGSNVQLGDNIDFNTFQPPIYGASSNLPDALTNQISYYPSSDYTKLSQNNTIVISGSMAKVFKVKVGDKLRLDVQSSIIANEKKYGKTIQVEIVAIMKSLSGFPAISDNIQDAPKSPVFIGQETWQTIVRANDGFNQTTTFQFEQNIRQIFVKDAGANLDTFKTQVFIKFGSKAFIVDYKERLNTLLTNLRTSTNALTMILSFSTIIAFFAVISSTISYINESKNEIAIMKAVGLKEKQIKFIFTLEAVIVSSTASLLGSLAGYFTGYLAEFTTSLEQNRPMQLVFPPIFVLVTFSLVIFFSIVGSYFPARKIYKIDTIRNLQ